MGKIMANSAFSWLFMFRLFGTELRTTKEKLVEKKLYSAARNVCSDFKDYDYKMANNLLNGISVIKMKNEKKVMQRKEKIKKI